MLLETVIVHEVVPEHPVPVQPSNVEPASGVAVSVTTVPVSYVAEHVLPQLIPPTFEATVPLPWPSRTIVSVTRGVPNLAVTFTFPLIVTVQGPVPEQPPPLQPSNVEPPA